jgi:tungstate transport system ATP-binding protein
MSAFTLNHVVKRYGQRTVLQIDSLSIAAGRTLAVLGPSGAGKSTLLRLLNFLEMPDSGEISFNGQPLTEPEPPLIVQRQVTTVFQRPLLLDTSVWNNVAYGLRLRGQYDQARVAAALEQVGLSHLTRASSRTLSGGEAQRVALARALVIAPRVLLLDEATANLDPANVSMIETIVGALRRQSQTTIVIVTHNLFQARRLADDAALLLDGKLVETGSVDQFFNRPRDQRTSAFCQGTMVY